LVIEDLLGGRMSDGLSITCAASGLEIMASARGVFESWTPLTPDFDISLTSSAVTEP
jgi:hypothetical protein